MSVILQRAANRQGGLAAAAATRNATAEGQRTAAAPQEQLQMLQMPQGGCNSSAIFCAQYYTRGMLYIMSKAQR